MSDKNALIKEIAKGKVINISKPPSTLKKTIIVRKVVVSDDTARISDLAIGISILSIILSVASIFI